MNSTRLWVIGSVAAIAVIALLGWLLGVSPKLAEAEAANLSRQGVDAQNQVHEATLVDLRDKFARLDELEADLTALQAEVPATHEIELFIDQVDAYAVAAGVGIHSIVATEALPYGAGAAPEQPATGGQLFSVPVTITVTGDFATVTAFSRLVQEGKRLFFAPKFDYSAGTGTLTGYIFVVDDPRGPKKADTPTTPEAPAPAETPAPTETPAP